jgi:hypothetical protein
VSHLLTESILSKELLRLLPDVMFTKLRHQIKRDCLQTRFKVGTTKLNECFPARDRATRIEANQKIGGY